MLTKVDQIWKKDTYNKTRKTSSDYCTELSRFNYTTEFNCVTSRQMRISYWQGGKPHSQYFKKFEDKCQYLWKENDRLETTNTSISRLSGHLKVHKPEWPMRFILHMNNLPYHTCCMAYEKNWNRFGMIFPLRNEKKLIQENNRFRGCILGFANLPLEETIN